MTRVSNDMLDEEEKISFKSSFFSHQQPPRYTKVAFHRCSPLFATRGQLSVVVICHRAADHVQGISMFVLFSVCDHCCSK